MLSIDANGPSTNVPASGAEGSGLPSTPLPPSPPAVTSVGMTHGWFSIGPPPASIGTASTSKKIVERSVMAWV